ncbi:MAG: hypothetical protein OES32_10605 [Acidobacteriota bacterium]|nr:hypothetical protein [Acidobacteriota bacterium]MDH3524026.1 hypothetical protein [Acidobacteriota bacterium]
MAAVDVALNWIHVLGAVVFLGTMFVGTFVLLPVLKTHLDYEHRHRFIVNFIPRVRGVVRVFVGLLVLSGIARAVLLHYSSDGGAGAARLGVFGVKVFFAAVPVLIFLLAPRILGAKSEEHLCCDPDADDSPVFQGVMTTKGAALHYTAIAGGWLAVLCGVVLAHMH